MKETEDPNLRGLLNLALKLLMLAPPLALLSCFFGHTGELFSGYATVCIASLCAYITREKSQYWIIGGLLLCMCIYFANWFFDDYRKTLAFPLAILCYIASKRFLPDPVGRLLEAVEERLIIRKLQLSGQDGRETDKKCDTTHNDACKKFRSPFRALNAQAKQHHKNRPWRRIRQFGAKMAANQALPKQHGIPNQP